MELALVSLGILSLVTLINKENFEETYKDSEQYVKQSVGDTSKINTFSPSETPKTAFVSGYNNQYINWNSEASAVGYPIQPESNINQKDWIQANSLYNKKEINGVPLKDYYEKYTKDILENGKWFLNKDMPQDTNQYLDDSQVQQRMEEMTGLRQQRDRKVLGKPNKTETMNLFTPAERTTSYGYQYGQSGGGGPGLGISRQKEMEEFKATMKFKTNEQPFEKIQVGRGLAIGTEVPAAGGFQQYTRVVPDNISDYKSNQLPGMVAGGKWVYSNAPTSQQPVLKNKPNTYYSLCQYGPAAGRSVMTAPQISPDYSASLKTQNREFVNYGFGIPLKTNLNSFLSTS